MRMRPVLSRPFLATLLIAFSIVSLFQSQPLVAEVPDNKLPFYGKGIKTEAMKALDEKFVQEAIVAAGTRAKALEQILDRGWQALERGDQNTAIKRFNQAYLLAPEDYRPYWGLGMITGMRGDTQQSEELFKQGYAYNSTDARFLSDYGFSMQQSALVGARDKIDPRPKFDQAAKIYIEAFAADPSAALPHSRMAVIHFYQKRCREAKIEVAEAKKRGGDGLDPRFEQDLKKQCP